MKKYLPVWFPLKEIKCESKNTSISSLAPKILTKKEDIEKIQPYLDKLRDTINAKDVNNIALTGSYGSGKSTIIKTFKNLNHNNEYLNISLASFNNTDKNKENLDKEQKKLNREELERLLEVSILQQIFYHVNPSKIPESRFKRIIIIPKFKLWLISIGFIFWSLSIILLLRYNYLDKINPINWHTKDNLDWFSILLVFPIAFFGVSFFSKSIVELFKNSKINKLNIKGELELGENINKSIFNEHLDEILYFFEMTHYNVVIFEDLDRFDNTDIFTKLREINILLNNSNLIEREIKFVYAIGDNLLKDKKERVKFFEYIIPIIPFINSSNADEQLKTLIKETDLDNNIFSNEFLSDVTIFIEDIDMRLLTNIFHEFVIYRNTLKPEFIKKPEELFAIIIYKNIDPEDFEKLNNKKGKLYNLINGKNKYVESLIKTLDDKIADFEINIEDIKKEKVLNLDELRSIYIIILSKKLPNASEIYLNNKRYNCGDLINEDLFNEVMKTSDFRYYQNGNGFYNSGISFSNIEKEVNSNYNYIKRESLILDKLNNKEQTLKNDIDNLKTKKAEINSWELKQIFEEIDLNQYLNDFSNNGLLRNLILNGYINENYNDYISLFHGVNLDKEDFQFKKNVVGKFQTDFYFKLSKIENLVDEIDERHFKFEFILNYDLLDFLGEKYSKYSSKYDAIVILLTNEKKRSIEFIDGYINHNSYLTKEALFETFGKEVFDEDTLQKINKKNNKKLDIFINKLTIYWGGFWEYIYINSNYPEDKVNMYLGLIIRFSKIETIINNQNKKLLKEAIEQNPHFLSLIEKSNELNFSDKISKLIEQLNVSFEILENPNNETKELFEFILNNGYYQINKVNLLQMLNLYGEKEETFETANYSTIQNSNCKPLIEYVNANINNYVDDVYLKLEQNNSENEDALLKLLNNEDLEDQFKIKIIQKVETLISNLSDIEDIQIKKELLINLKVVVDWDNVIDYFNNCEDKIDEKLIEYLNTEEVSNQLSELSLSKDDKKFEGSLLVCNEIKNDIYKKLLDCIYYVYNQLSFENLSEHKVVSLVERKLTITKSNYDKLRENFADNHITLIVRDFNTFFEKIEDFETDVDDILSILKYDKITIDNRFKYISKLTVQTIIDNKAIAKKVGEIILSKSSKIEFEFNTIESIVKSLDSTENKVKFVNLYFTELSNENIISLVKSLSYNHSELFVKQHKPLFNDNIYNRDLLTKLKSKGLINSFGIYVKDNSKIKAVANY
ncbi:YobI family P-loop NTPase [Flavobacterium rhamnosiphilum]